MSTDVALKKSSIANVHVVAGTPAEMEQAQGDLVAWANSKVEEERSELADAEDNLAIAERSKWRKEPWKRRVAQHKKRLTFYEKVKAALEAGYYIVPPFPVQIFAIRTKAKKPRHEESARSWAEFRQKPLKLPIGDGKWVSPLPEIWQNVYEYRDKEGNDKTDVTFYPKDFNEVDFPFSFAKPQVLEATSKAMQSAIFDQLGVLPTFRTRGDPIVVGQILHPTPHKEPLTFFVSWWLDTKDL